MALRWLCILLVAAGGPAWIYFRDWAPPASPGHERTQAASAARVACGGCQVHVIRRSSPGRWLVRLRGTRASACVMLAIDETSPRRVSRPERTPCPRGPASSGPQARGAAVH